MTSTDELHGTNLMAAELTSYMAGSDSLRVLSVPQHKEFPSVSHLIFIRQELMQPVPAVEIHFPNAL